MYPSAERIRRFLHEHPDKPFVCCEYSHAMGNSCGGMHKYTDLAYEEPRYQGGFIWDYIDQSIYKKNRYGQEFLAYGGDFDDRPSDYNFSGNGVVYGGSRLPSPKMQEVKYNYQNIVVSFMGEFPVEGCMELGIFSWEAAGQEALGFGSEIHDTLESGSEIHDILGSGSEISEKRILHAVKPESIHSEREEFGRFVVWNQNLFVNTDQFDAVAVLLREGFEMLRVPMQIAVAPGEKKEFALPQEIGDFMALAGPAEYAVAVSFSLKEDCIWAKAGHEVAFGQAVIKTLQSHVDKSCYALKNHADQSINTAERRSNIKFVVEGIASDVTGVTESKAEDGVSSDKIAVNGGLRVVRGHSNIGVHGENFHLLFSTTGQGLVSYVYGGVELIPTAPKPNFWRAPTDNDMGNRMPQRYAQWKIASMYVSLREPEGNTDVTPEVLCDGMPLAQAVTGGEAKAASMQTAVGEKAKAASAQTAAGGEAKTATAEAVVEGETKAVIAAAAVGGQANAAMAQAVTEAKNSRNEYRAHEVSVKYRYYMPTTPLSSCEVTYLVHADGAVTTTLTYDPVFELGDMPEFGMLYQLDADYDRITWYGLGEAETYSDRCRGGRLGIYEGKVAEQMAEYLMPQECGNKCGVRWAKVTNRKGRGMLFSGDALSFSALPYTPHELENAMHAYELPPAHHTVVRVAQAQMGVAGDDSWGARTHPEYLLDVSGRKVFTYSFRGV